MGHYRCLCHNFGAVIITRIFFSLHLADFKEWIDITLGIASISGIILGGWWTFNIFIKNRMAISKANIELVVNDFKLEGKHLLRSVQKIKNAGSVVLEIRHLRIKVFRVSPCSAEIRSLIESIEYPVKQGFENEELPWELLYENQIDLLDDKIQIIEPGEEDSRYYDIV